MHAERETQGEMERGGGVGGMGVGWGGWGRRVVMHGVCDGIDI